MTLAAKQGNYTEAIAAGIQTLMAQKPEILTPDPNAPGHLAVGQQVGIGSMTLLPPRLGFFDITLGYRTESFTVPVSWFKMYTLALANRRSAPASASSMARYSAISSVSHTLDFVWSEFRAAARGSQVDFLNLIGCYNIHRDEGPSQWPYFFWWEGWGAPLQVHTYMCQLAYTYAAEAELTRADFAPAATGVNQCEGISTFIRKALRGEKLEDPREPSREQCQLIINYKNFDSRYNSFSHDCFSDIDCSSGYCGLPSPNFDNWLLTYSFSNNCWGRDGESVCRAPDPCPSGISDDDSMKIALSPATLAWEGISCDWILFLARMSLDYARYLVDEQDIGGAQPYFKTAIYLGRYALRILTEL
jgi:hypothetical protein